MSTDHVKHELWRMVVGRELGHGSARYVYEHALDPTLVVKVETADGSFQNVKEWETWQFVHDTPHARWFAPCVAISPCGSVLLQRRTEPATSYPDELPNYLTDFKLGNYGMLTPEDGGEPRFVCHDYGFTRIMLVGLTRRMARVSWVKSLDAPLGDWG